MNGQRQKQSRLRLQHDGRPVHRDVGVIARGMRGKLRQNQVMQCGLCPTRLRQQVMSLAEGVKAADQIGFGLAVRQGALGNRRDHCEGIFHAMTELGGQHLLLFFRRQNIGDIDKSQQHAIDFVITSLVGKDACKVMAVSARHAHSALGDFSTGADRPDIILQLGIIDAADNIGEGSSTITRNEIEQPRDCRREASHHEIAVEKNGGYLGTLKQVVEITIGAIQLVNLAAQLVIDGLQYFVDRLQFLL